MKRTVTSPSGNLTAEVTTFVGRRREAAEVRKHLAASRLVTLAGVGGVGKTRLALKVAADVARAYDDGVWVVDLAPVEDAALLAQTVGSALGIQDRGTTWSLAVLAESVRDKKQLVVLDGCEHLRDGCAVLVDTLLRQAPHLRILVTTRQTLGLTGELVYQVPTLSTPTVTASTTPATANNYEAIALFVERTRAVRPDFHLADDNAVAIAAVCERLDGIPLAIELAASRMSTLSPDELLGRLQDRFKLLVGGSAVVLPRHQTLRELISWSWDLCTPDEQTLWARASVFPSDFDLSSAEAVCSGGAVAQEDVFDIVSALVAKTVVSTTKDGGATRYRMLETLREFGRGQLDRVGGTPAVKEEHRRYFQHVAAESARQWFGPNQSDVIRRVRPALNDFRTALDTSFETPERVDDGLAMAADLFYFWVATGHTNEARQWLDRGLRFHGANSLERGRAMHSCAYLAVAEGDLDAANSLVQAAQRVALELGDPSLNASVTQLCGAFAMYRGDRSNAERLLSEALEAHEQLRNTAEFVDTAFSLAAVRVAQGDLDAADELCRAGITECDRYGDRWSKGYLMWVLGLVRLRRGAVAEAEELAYESLSIGELLLEPWLTACCFELLSAVASAQHDPKRAARLIGAAAAIWHRTGTALSQIANLIAFHDESASLVQEELGEDLYAKLVSDGASMTAQQALEEARGGVARTGNDIDVVAALAPLTSREAEVARLVSEGLTNREVSERLFIAQRTAEAHVERILGRLGFKSRAQIAGWVVEQTLSAEDSSVLPENGR